MQPTYVHTKLRRTFGRQCLFSDRHEILVSIPTDFGFFRENYVLENPTQKSTQLSSEYASNEVSTDRKTMTHRGMLHAQGGFPKDVNYLDEEQPVRYKRKIEKEENYSRQVGELVKTMDRLVLQNNAVNLYQQYFENMTGISGQDVASLEQVQLYTEPNSVKRPIRHISWSVDGGSHLASAHADMSETSPTDSYIWDVENPTAPVAVLKPDYQILSLEFNPKDPPILASALLNGQVAVWDYRIPKEPVALSKLEVSHRIQATSALWVNSKSGKEFFSGSSDGQVIFWDYRKLHEPIDSLLMDPIKTDAQNLARAQGVSVLEYETTIPTKFMVGTEQGMIFSCNRKGKTPIEKINFKLQGHFGPVLTLARNPSYLKTFLTVGDWNARIWSEDNRDNPISWTKNHKVNLTSGCWSPGRCSLFFLSRVDGVLDAWDFLHQQDEPVISLKVCESPICTLRSHDGSRIIACGNDVGCLYLTRVSSNLAKSAKTDKGLLTSMMDRESKREKIISDKTREINLKLRTMELAKDIIQSTPSEEEQQSQEERKTKCTAAEMDFYNLIEKEKDKLRVAYLGDSGSEHEATLIEDQDDEIITVSEEVITIEDEDQEDVTVIE